MCNRKSHDFVKKVNSFAYPKETISFYLSTNLGRISDFRTVALTELLCLSVG